MKLQEILSPSFSDQLRRIRAGIAERAARHLIIRNTDSVPTATGDLVRDHLSADSLFCKACVAGGYLTPQKARKIDIADLVHESECLGAGTGITP